MSSVPIFRPSFGNRPDRIVGREDVLQLYSDGLASYPGSRDRSVLITGQRGMGKTALLLEMTDAAAEAGFVPARVTCGPTMLDDIIDEIQRKGAPFVKDRKAPIKGFNAGALGFSFGLTFTEEARNSYGFRAKLEMICDRLAEAGRGVALLVDEVQPASEPIRQLATTYQELVGGHLGSPRGRHAHFPQPRAQDRPRAHLYSGGQGVLRRCLQARRQGDRRPDARQGRRGGRGIPLSPAASGLLPSRVHPRGRTNIRSDSRARTKCRDRGPRHERVQGHAAPAFPRRRRFPAGYVAGLGQAHARRRSRGTARGIARPRAVVP